MHALGHFSPATAQTLDKSLRAADIRTLDRATKKWRSELSQLMRSVVLELVTVPAIESRHQFWSTTMIRLPVFSISLTLITAAVCAAGDLTTFRDPDGRFMVRMPGRPMISNEDANGSPMKTYVVDDTNGACLVSVMDIPEVRSESNRRIQQRLDAGVQALERALGGKVVHVQRIVFDRQHPGREVRLTVKDGPAEGMARAFFFLADGKLFQVLAVGTNDWIDGADRTEFLQSFQLR